MKKVKSFLDKMVTSGTFSALSLALVATTITRQSCIFFILGADDIDEDLIK